MFEANTLVTQHLWLGLSLFMIIIIVLNRTQFFQEVVLDEISSPAGKLLLIVLFAVIGILGTYWSIDIGIGTINTRAVGVIVSGLIGGRRVGLATGAIVGLHRLFFMENFSTEESAAITVIQGWMAGMLSPVMKEQKKMWPYALKVGFSLEVLHMILLLIFATPYESALALVEAIALPMLATNSVGVAVFIGIMEDNYESNERLKAATTKTALSIANLTLPILRNGFNNQSAQEIVTSINNVITSFACTAILTNKQIMAASFKDEAKSAKLVAYLEEYIKMGLDNHDESKDNVTEKLAISIYSGDSQGSKDFFEKVPGEDTPFSAKTLTPIFNGDVQVASLFLGKTTGSITDSEIELSRGLGNLISEQIEIGGVKEQAKLLVNAELRALQYQINPHFLFNALNTISYHCRQQPETAKQLLTYLADYYRYNLTDTSSLISLQEELQHINAYVSIEMARFGDRLKIHYKGAECDFKIPALIMQPLVENAVKHGILPKAEGGDITIEITRHAKYFQLSVCDNGVGMEEGKLENILYPDAARKSIGLSNVHKRLLIMYGPDYGLSITSKKNIGTSVSFKVPICKETI